MAMSFSRPDPSSPTSIADATFGTSRRGFDQAEVKDFLRMVAAEFGRLRERERFLERELQSAQTDGGPARVDEAMMTQMLGEEAVRVLTTARESANEIREKAEDAASRLLNDAADDAARAREDADIESTRRRADAAADAEAELSMAKQQGREMVNEARAYRERVLSELARRRELAREQIEQLIHGRDRLMQAFERARLVAVDVVAEMQPLGEPDEYVNLSPTTGPLPVMIANSPRPLEVVADPVDDEVAPDAGEVDEIEIVDSDSEVDENEADETAGVHDESDAVLDESGAVELDAEPADDAIDDPDAAVETRGENDDDVAADELDESAAPDEQSALDDDDGGDVVVDLFARLRADTAPAELDNEVWPDDPDVIADTESDSDAVSTDVDAELDDRIAVVPDDDEAAEPEQTVFELRDEVITPIIVASAKKLKRALADEQNDVLDALRRSDAVHHLDALLPWVSEHTQRYTAAVADDLLDAVYEGSATSHSTNRKIRKTLAADAVAVADEALQQWLVVPLRDRLTRCIADSAGDNAVVTKKVRAVYREWKTQRIDETLDDIVRCAHGRGVLAGFDLDTPTVWQVDSRFAACPDCEDNVLAGAVAAGARFPTGDTFAPAHQGCRCLLVAADR